VAKVLLVEDDFSLRDVYSARFAAEGYTVVTASDGEEALAAAVREHPDLIVLDVMMPKISGFDVLDILRSTPATKATKVIMMTALSQDADRQRGEALGVDKYLVKSQVTLEDVAIAVKQTLSGAPNAGGSVLPPTPPVV
jgi:two-component system phosphate regulon response regulator PhoB